MISIEPVLRGERLALARLLTEVENDTPAGRAALDALFPYARRAHRIGVTGAPGTGKSSLVNQLARHFRQENGGASGRRVAIIAVDPSSPFSGGAILGDRVRMRDLAGDPGVFIRSMASRGALGGLAWATSAAALVFDAAGYDIVLIETVGAGQAEVDIARLAHTTLVIEAPGLGDDIQAIKAGILEIADILVINKADRPGVENAERALRGMLELAHPAPRQIRHHGKLMDNGTPHTPPADASFWLPPILRTVATEGAGIAELAQAIAAHRLHAQATGGWEARERTRLETELSVLLQETLVARWRSQTPVETIHRVMDALRDRRIAPNRAVELLLAGGEDDLR